MAAIPMDDDEVIRLDVVVLGQRRDRTATVVHAVVESVDQVAEARIDVVPIQAHIVRTRATDDAAHRPVVTRPDRLVVAVEQEPVLVLERTEVGLVVGQEERFEEPGDMSRTTRPSGRIFAPLVMKSSTGSSFIFAATAAESVVPAAFTALR